MVQGAQLFMNNFANQTGGGGAPVGNRVALAEACDVACDTHLAAAVGRLGRRAGRPRHHRRQRSRSARVTYNVGGFAAGLDRACCTDSFRVGVTAGYTDRHASGSAGFDGKGAHQHLPGRPLRRLRPGTRSMPTRIAGLRLHARTRCGGNIPIPGLQPRTAQGLTGANQFYGQVETGYRFDLGTQRRRLRHAVRATAGPTPATQNAFTETGAQSLNLTVAAADHQLAALGDRRAARRRDGPRLAREAGAAVPAGLEPRVCRRRRGR